MIRIKSSFRDPSGFVFIEDGVLYRSIAICYKDNYEHATKSGLYEQLMSKRMLVPHHEIDSTKNSAEIYKVITPEKILFISYPYEWCFSELKDAALLTLEIQKLALEKNMSLKDASAYNIQFQQGKPIFIDTLSFEKYEGGSPWQGYRQFCQHFLAPLVLMSYCDLRSNQLSRLFIDGIPLDLASSLLPLRSFFNPSVVSHIHLHARSQWKYAHTKEHSSREVYIPRKNLIAFIHYLDLFVRNLRPIKQKTEWQHYYKDTNYSDLSFDLKKRIVDDFLEIIKPKIAWDIGANSGEFSRVASDRGIDTISFDVDPVAVEINYLETKQRNEKNLLPLVLDITNPSPAIGWNNEERPSLTERNNADIVLALALVHHLAISNNFPLGMIAEYFGRIAPHLVIEFVPKDDSQVKRLLTSRKDIFPEYTEQKFEEEFGKYFLIRQKKEIGDSKRHLYLMSRRHD